MCQPPHLGRNARSQVRSAARAEAKTYSVAAAARAVGITGAATWAKVHRESVAYVLDAGGEVRVLAFEVERMRAERAGTRPRNPGGAGQHRTRRP